MPVNALDLNLEVLEYNKGFLYSRDFYNHLNCFERSFENISGSVLRDTTVVHHGSVPRVSFIIIEPTSIYSQGYIMMHLTRLII